VEFNKNLKRIYKRTFSRLSKNRGKPFITNTSKRLTSSTTKFRNTHQNNFFQTPQSDSNQNMFGELLQDYQNFKLQA